MLSGVSVLIRDRHLGPGYPLRRGILKMTEDGALVDFPHIEVELMQLDDALRQPTVHDSHPWRSYPGGGIVELPRLPSLFPVSPTTEKALQQFRSNVPEPNLYRPESLVTISAVELFQRETAMMSFGAHLTMEDPLIYRHTGSTYGEFLLFEAINLELFMPDRADLRFLFASVGEFPDGIAEGDHCIVTSVVKMEEAAEVPTISFKPCRYPIRFRSVLTRKMEFIRAGARTAVGYLMPDESGNYRCLSRAQGFERVDIPEELLPLTLRTSRHALVNFTMDKLYTSVMFPILQQESQPPSPDKPVWKSRCYSLKSSSLRRGTHVVSVEPLDNEQRRKLSDRLSRFSRFNTADTVWEMTRFFGLGETFRMEAARQVREAEAAAKEDAEEEQDNDVVLRTVVDVDIVTVDILLPLLAAIYDRAQTAYVESPEANRLTIGEMPLNDGQSRVTRAYLAADGPRMMAVMAPPGSGKTAVAAAMAAAAVERKDVQLIVGMQNTAVDNIGAALKKMQVGCISAEFSTALRLMRQAGERGAQLDSSSVESSVENDAVADPLVDASAPTVLYPRVHAESVYNMKARRHLKPEEPHPFDVYDQMSPGELMRWVDREPGTVPHMKDSCKVKSAVKGEDDEERDPFEVALNSQLNNHELTMSCRDSLVHCRQGAFKVLPSVRSLRSLRSLRIGRLVTSVRPLSPDQSHTLKDRLSGFRRFGQPGALSMMRKFFEIGGAFRSFVASVSRTEEVPSKADEDKELNDGDESDEEVEEEEDKAEEATHNSEMVQRTVRRRDIATDEELMPLLSAIYDKESEAYVAPAAVHRLTVGEMHLNEGQSRVALAYVDANGPRVMAVLAPPGSGKTAVAAAMAAAATEQGGEQLIVAVQNCAVDNIGCALRKMQSGCIRAKESTIAVGAEHEMTGVHVADPMTHEDVAQDRTVSPSLKLCPQVDTRNVYNMKARMQLDPEHPKPFDVYDRMSVPERSKWIEREPGIIPYMHDPFKVRRAGTGGDPPGEFEIALSKQINNLELSLNESDSSIILSTIDKALSKCFTPCMLSECTLKRVRRVIIDEASLLTEAALFAMVKRFPKARFVLIGDPQQLPPFMYEQGVLGHELAGRSALDVALRNPSVYRVQLDEVYRAPPSLVAPYSRLAYGGQLRARKAEESVGVLTELGLVAAGASQLLFVNIESSHDTPENSQSLFNTGEIEELEKLLMKIPGSMSENVMIICLYKEQKKRVEERFPSFAVFTVDSAQGKEGDIVFLLTTRTSAPSRFFCNRKRINVSVSRQKRGLVVMGRWDMLSVQQPWSTVVNKGDFTLTNYLW